MQKGLNNMGKKYYWLKLKEDFFNNIRMKKLRRIAGGEIFTIIYLKMQLLSLQNEGALIYEGIEETFTDEIALKIDEDPENVKLTCIFLQNCGLIEQTDDNTFVLTETVDCIGKESESAKRMRKLRENSSTKRLETSQCDASVTQLCENVRECDTEKEIEKEKDIDIEIEKKNVTRSKSTSVDKPKKEKPIKHKYGEYNNVLLSDAEVEKLKTEFPNDYQSRIERLSGYMQSTGKSYKDHLATIRNWARRDNNNGYSKPSYSQRNYSQPAQPKREETEEERQQRVHEQYLRAMEAFGVDPNEEFDDDL